jgi:hypothetical protein
MILPLVWKLLPWIAHLLFWSALAWIAWIVFGPGGKRRSARILDDGRVEFAPHWLIICVWLFLIGSAAWPSTSELMHNRGHAWNFIILVSLGLAALGMLFEFPGSVAVTGDGLEQVYWFWRNKRIRWNDIVEIESGPKDRTVTITSANGTRIVHSRFLADRQRFLLELKEHCGDQLPQDFPREPIDGL